MEKTMNWTEKQQKVIDSRNKNLLISAAAGSGKTAVLVERIKNIIIQDKVDVRELLVVTFTKAAASEMKEKNMRNWNLFSDIEAQDRDFNRRLFQIRLNRV